MSMEEFAARILTEGGLVQGLLFGGLVYVWRELKSCQSGHLDCEKRNLVLAHAVEDIADDKMHDARSKAQTIIATASADPPK